MRNFGMSIVEEECDEGLYWMELLIDVGIMQEPLLKDLMNEADQILVIAVSSIKTARKHK